MIMNQLKDGTVYVWPEHVTLAVVSMSILINAVIFDDFVFYFVYNIITRIFDLEQE